MVQEVVRPLFIEVDRDYMLLENGGPVQSHDPTDDRPKISRRIERTLAELARRVAAGDPVFMVIRGPAVKRSAAVMRVAQNAARLADKKLAWIEWDVHAALTSSPWVGQREWMVNQFVEVVRKTAQVGHLVVVYLDCEEAFADRRTDNSRVLVHFLTLLHDQPRVATFISFENLGTVDPAIFRKVPSVVIPD